MPWSPDPGEDFFDVGGGSLAAAHLVSRLRERFPEVTVADVYDHPRLGDLAAMLDELATPSSAQSRLVRPVPFGTQLGQVLFTIPVRTLTGLRWVVWVAAGDLVARSWFGLDWLPTARWWVVVLGWLVLVSPAGRLVLSAAGARALLAGVTPGRYPRGGWVHLRLWAADRLTDELGAANLAGAPWMRLYARALGAHVGKHVDLHALPPVTGMVSFGDGCSVEPEVDLSGHWLDGDELHIGSVEIGSGRPDRGTQHPRARQPRRRRCRDRAGLSRVRSRAGRRVVGRRTRTPGGSRTRTLGRRATAQQAAVARGIRARRGGDLGASGRRAGGGHSRGPRAAAVRA